MNKNVWLMLVLVGLFGCSQTVVSPPEITLQEPPLSIQPQDIPLKGEAAQRDTEFSGMDWYGSQLVLLPQYPEKFAENGTGSLFYMDEKELVAFFNGEISTIEPRKIPIFYEGLADRIPGYEGFESIVFIENEVFCTIEASHNGMMGYWIRGKVEVEPRHIVLDVTSLQTIVPQADIPNASDESMLYWQDHLITLYEANGCNINQQPQAHCFQLDGLASPSISFPQVEYRITDVTQPDVHGYFWAINYFWPGDAEKYQPQNDLFLPSSQKMSEILADGVERLLQFRITEAGVVAVSHYPLILSKETGVSSNWEGLVRWHSQGFLMITDKYPQTRLAFVPFIIEEEDHDTR